MTKANFKRFWARIPILYLFLFITLTTQAQNVSVSLKETPLKEILTTISKQSGYSFIYSNLLKDLNKKVDFTYSGTVQQLDAMLKHLFSETDILYTVKGKQIILQDKDLKTSLNKTKNTKISGLINDDAGVPIAGASVKNKNTGEHVATDINGMYSIVANKGDVLLINSIGMEESVITVDDNLEYNLNMQVDLVVLDEVVVTGYQTISKERSTGAFAKISPEKLQLQRLNNLSTLLDGQVAGFSNGLIRGTTTMKGVASPLYVIDGFPVENTRYTSYGSLQEKLPDLNMEDIESITVLKDASATSIYGARAANGVIVIVTKKASKGETNISFSANLTITPYKYYTDRLTNSADIIDLEREWAEQNKNLKGSDAATYADNTLKNAVYNNDGIKAILKAYTGYMSASEVDNYLNNLSSKGYNYFNDLEKYAKRNAISQQYNLSIGKSSAVNNFNFSATYKHNILEDIYSKNDDIGLNFMNSTDITKWLKFEIGTYIKFGNDKAQSYSVTSPGYSYLPYNSLVNSDGSYYTSTSADRLSEDKQNTIDKYGLYSMDITPLEEIGKNISQTRTFSNRTLAKLSIKFCDYLRYSAMFQYEYANDKYSLLKDKSSYAVRSQVNGLATYSPNTGVVYNLPYGDILSTSVQEYNAYNFRQQLDFNKNIANRHDITAILGSETRHSKLQYDQNSVYGYDPSTLSGALINTAALTKIYNGLLGGTFSNPVSKRETVNRFVSIYANAAYTYNGKYSATGSIRWDRSNLWGTDSKYQNKPLWSVGAAWNIDKERFLKGLKWINMLKLRTSYGIGGNISKQSAPYLTAYYNQNNNIGGIQATVSSRPNPLLTWEKTITFNVGLDYAFLFNRLQGSVEFYNKNGKDLLSSTMGVPTEGFGYSTYSMNNGQMRNRGVEITINGEIIRKKNLSLSASLLYAYNNNKITYVNVKAPVYYLQLDQPQAYPIIGNPYNSLYGYNWAGLSDKGLPQVYDEKGEKVITSPSTLDAIKYLGSKDPIHSGSFSSTFRYKNLAFSFMFIFEGGHKMWNTDLPFLNSAYNSAIYSYATNISAVNKDIINRWRKAGDEAYTDIPRAVFAESSDYNSNSYTIYSKADINVLDASNIRLSNISLSYQLPKQLCNRIFMKGIRAQFNIENLCTIAFDKKAKYLLGGYNSPNYVFGLYFNL